MLKFKNIDFLQSSKYKKLKEITISQATFATLILNNNQLLERVQIVNNTIKNTTKPFSLLNLKCLIYLDLTANRIQNLPIFKGDKLRTVKLQGNRINEKCDFLKSNFPSLTQLKLSGNQLKLLPKLSAPNLQMLTSKRNLIQSIDQFTLGHYLQLEHLELDQNHIYIFPLI